jgi:hypothetical protein
MSLLRTIRRGLSALVSPSRAVSDGRGAVSLTWTPGSGAALSGAIAGTDVHEAYVLHAGPAVIQAGAPLESSVPATVKVKAATHRPRR